MAHEGPDIQYQFKSAADTAAAQMTVAEVCEALHLDPKFVLNFFLAEELEFAIPDFHVDCFLLMTMKEVQYIALALPRGHAKTTLMKLVCVWHIMFTTFRFVLYVSNTLSVAAEAVKDIANYFRSPNFVEVFGQVEFTTEQDNRGFYKFWLEVPDLLQPGVWRRKFVILKALGAGQQVRGTNIDNTRPELVCVDDLEDDDNTGSPILQKKLIRWFYGPLFKALSKKRHKLIMSGNMLSNKSLLYHVVERSDQFYSVRYGCLRSDGTPLWADLWPLEAIKKDFLEYQKLGLIDQWFAEMMNMPIAVGQGLILGEEIPYGPLIVPGQQEMAFMTLDPALSKETWANNSAIAVHASVNGIWRIVEIVQGKYDANELFFLLLSLCNKWRTRVVGIEAAAYQSILQFVFNVLMQVHNQHFTVYMVPHKNKTKTERLLAWCAFLKKRLWMLMEGDYAITEQLLAYDPAKANNVDDVIDACAMGPRMTEMYMPAILEAFTVAPETQVVRSGYAVASN